MLFRSDYILIHPGQTMDVLVYANQNVGQYYMATRPFSDGGAMFINITTAVFQYTNSEGGLNASLITLPARNDTNATNNFVSRIRNANVTQNPPLNVPTDIDRRVYIAIATNTLPCNTSECLVPNRIVASLNNVSFVFPRIDILQAYYNRYKRIGLASSIQFNQFYIFNFYYLCTFVDFISFAFYQYLSSIDLT